MMKTLVTIILCFFLIFAELEVGREPAASVDSSVNPDEQTTSEEKIKSDQSVTGGDIAGIGISPVKEEVS